MEIFRAYDIRGEYSKDIKDSDVYKIARILVRNYQAKTLAIGRDISLASPKIHQAIIRGAIDQGADVYDLGITGTDVVYFATGHCGYDLGIEVTASHSAGHLSGIKMVSRGVSPIAQGFGMEKLREDFLNYQHTESVAQKGQVQSKDIWPDFIAQVLAFTNCDSIKPLKIVADASNAVGSVEINHLAKKLPQIDFIKLNWELDGHYPGHQPNPFLEENRQQLVSKVKETGADLGIAFDGDADRIYFIDENGDFIFGVYINALIAEKMCHQNPGRVVLHDVRAMRYIKKKVLDAGGIPKIELVGHAFFKQRMRKENALFGGESSGHIYYNFGDFMAENSLIALVQILEIISLSGKNLGELTRDARMNYPVSGEWNFSLPGFGKTDDLTPEALKAMDQVLEKVKSRYSDGKISNFDTLTVEYPDWNFNLRPSANDPLLRFTGEANNVNLLLKKQAELFALLKAEGCTYVDNTGVKVLL
jgi:phosphomannomutase